MTEKYFEINSVPAVLYGGDGDKVWLFVHGKCGCKEEAEAFARIVCPAGQQVLAIDLPDHGQRKGQGGFDPWHAVPELVQTGEFIRSRWGSFSLRANSIGAWFSLLAFKKTPPDRALLVSPVLDMEALIRGMLSSIGADEARLEREGEIPTPFGETLSRKYLQYVINNPPDEWRAPSFVLYAGRDELTSRATVDDFCSRFGCELTVMEDGEHWFHTPPQLQVLKAWEKRGTGVIPSPALKSDF